MRRIARLFSALLASIPACAGAQNLLVNGTFDTDVSGWTTLGTGATGPVVFSPLDADGSPASGSMQLNNNTAGAGVNPRSSQQCRAATAGTSYDFAGKMRIPTGQVAGQYYVLLNFHANPTCTGSGLGFARLDYTPSGAWQGLSRTGLVAPAGTVAVSITLSNFKNEAGGSTTAYFDDLVLAATGTLRITITIPVAASIHGANNTFFHTDVWIFNRSFTNSNAVTLVYRCFGGVGCGSAKVVNLAPRETRLITDVIGTLFGVPETGGAIELSHDSFNGPVTARSRLFTPTSPPSYGFGVPALPASSATARATFLGIAGSGPNLTAGFRSNAGAYNPNTVPVTVTFTLYDGTTGAILGAPFVRVWAPFEAAQVSNLTATLGAATVTTNAILVAISVGGDVFFYAATVDNISGDSFWIIASADEPPVP